MNIQELADSLSDYKGIDRNKVLSILYTRISSGLEMGEETPSKFGVRSPSDVWNKANEHLMLIAETNPKEAFQLGLALLNLPKSGDVKRESINEWMRTSGLMLLGLDRLKREFSDYLDNGSGSQDLVNKLKMRMNADVSDLTSSHDFDGNPKGYSTIQTVYICLGLKNEKGKLAGPPSYTSRLKKGRLART